MSFVKRIVNGIVEIDFENILSSFWENISPVSKKSFLWIFVIVNLVFVWHTITFIPDNHSLGLLKTDIPWDFQYGIGIGRFAGGFLQQLVGGGIFPVINSLLCYAGFAIAMVYLANYWYVPKTVLSYTLFGIFAILTPYTLPWVYFLRHNTYFWNIFLMMYGLTILLKPKFFNVLIAFILFFIGLGTYLSMIQFICIVFFGRCLLDILFNQSSLVQLWDKYKGTILTILFTSIMYGMVVLCSQIWGNWINREQTEFSFLTLNKIAFASLSFLLPTPYLSSVMKMLLFVPIILVLAYTFKKKNYWATWLILGILSVSQLTGLLSSPYFIFATRIQFWGIPWCWCLFLVCCLKFKKLKNVTLMGLLICSYYFALQDMRWQKHFYFEQIYEMSTYQNIIFQIKQNPLFDPDKEYDLILIGNLSYRGAFSKENAWGGPYTQGSFSSIHPDDIFNFFEKKSYIKRFYQFLDIEQAQKMGFNVDFLKDIKKSYKSSVYIEDSTIYIVLNKKGLGKD